MRVSLILSFVAHSALLIASVVALPAAKPLRVEEPPPVPVEILTLEEFTKLSSKKTEKVVEKPIPIPPEPAKPEKKKAKKKKPKPKTPPRAVEPVAPVEKPQTVAAVIRQLPEPVAAPEPEPVAPPPEPVAKPKPAPEPEPVVAPLPKVEPKPEPKPVAQPAPPKPKVEPKKPVTTAKSPPSPRVKPKPPKKIAKKKPKKPVRKAKRKKPKKPKFDADRIAALLNKLPDAPKPAPVATGGLAKKSKLRVAGLDQRVTRSELEYLRQQISRCWSPPVAISGAENLAVKVKLTLRRDGSLAGAPIVLNTGPTGFRVAAEAAVRAVNECQPFDMPGEKFDAWAEVTINFDPRFMLGG